MGMKGFLLITALVLAGFTAIASAEETGDIPDLIGTWNCIYLEFDSQNLDYEANDTPIRTLHIETQNGRIFEGYKDYVWTEGENSKQIKERFLGAIGNDNKTLYLNDFSSGVAFGEILSPGEITVYYMHSYTVTGKKDYAVAVADFVRE